MSTNAHTIPINLETWYGVIAAIWPKFALMHGHLFHSPIVSHLFSILFRYLISAQATKEDQFVPDVKNSSSTTTTTTTAKVTGPEDAETRPKKHLVQTGEYLKNQHFQYILVTIFQYTIIQRIALRFAGRLGDFQCTIFSSR